MELTRLMDVLLRANPDKGWFPFWGGFGFFGLFWIIVFIIGVLLCIWIYRDANRRGMSGMLWAALMILGCFFFLGWLVVLIIYLVVRR